MNLQPQRQEYSLLRHHVGNMPTLLQGNRPDDRVHCVGKNEVYSGASEMIWLNRQCQQNHDCPSQGGSKYLTFLGFHLITLCNP